MKKALLLFMFLVLQASSTSTAQDLNWNKFEPQSHHVYGSMGLDFGTVIRLGYGYTIQPSIPLLLSWDLSHPMGGDLFDDFKTTFGGQTDFYQLGRFHFGGKLLGVLNKNETALVGILSLGTEVSLFSGYYGKYWHFGADLGLSTSLLSNLEHSAKMKALYPKITDGWFSATGGNFNYGLFVGYTPTEALSFSIKLGGLSGWFGDTNPNLPFFAHLGVSWKIYTQGKISPP